ncbi:unnamed protein product, partial [Mesorhabditis belari]|uniref:Saccharopine dehydrogenase NADP binding domain-containing protein n=1 Tax=Mesorhabditis belari TaxID=2138241 RepID=A0AAF3FBC8_9BILA
MPSEDRFDIVIYGATGFTGLRCITSYVSSKLFKGITLAVAGRNETKLRQALDKISIETGVNTRDVSIIVASTEDPESLHKMARRARVIVNAVGPYRLHGEAVVKAAVEEGASHVDISGEPAFLEKMQMKYGELAKEKGVYVVGACGWDSIPADLGVNYLKKHFPGDLNHVETFVQLLTGPAGYSFNAGTYQTLVLGISSVMSDKLGQIRRQIMPEKIPRSAIRPPKRGKLWQIDAGELNGGWALPFMGSDKSIVQRSQYYQYVEKQERPVAIETYIRIGSLLWAVLLVVWVSIFSLFCMWTPTRRFLQKYPDLCSFNMFKNAGPTQEQMEQAGFIYWFIGSGYSERKSLNEQHQGQPDKRVVVSCRGPDAGYIATSAMVMSSALAIINDKKTLPKNGGVYTTASAFADTKIYEYLRDFGVTFQVENEAKL